MPIIRGIMLDIVDYPWTGQSEQLQVHRWKVVKSRTLVDTLMKTLVEAYMSCTFGNSEPPLIRVGKGFAEELANRVALASSTEKVDITTFMDAKVICEDRGFDSWTAHIFMWDVTSYMLPILFVAAVVELVDGA